MCCRFIWIIYLTQHKTLDITLFFKLVTILSIQHYQPISMCVVVKEWDNKRNQVTTLFLLTISVCLFAIREISESATMALFSLTKHPHYTRINECMSHLHPWSRNDLERNTTTLPIQIRLSVIQRNKLNWILSWYDAAKRAVVMLIVVLFTVNRSISNTLLQWSYSLSWRISYVCLEKNRLLNMGTSHLSF
jgi:hypothetical protein